MSRSVNINNTESIIADSIFLIDSDNLTDIRSLFLYRTEASDIVGIPPDTLNTLQEIADAINNDPNFFQTINNELNLKRNITDSYSKTDVNTLLLNHYTKTESDTLLNAKLNASVISNYYNKTEIDGFNNLRYLKTETNNLLNLKVDTTTFNTANQQRIQADANLEASILLKQDIINDGDLTIAKTNGLQAALNLKANSSDVYTKAEADNLLSNKLDTSVFNTQIALKANIADVYYKSVLYTKTEVDSLVSNTNLSNYYTKTESNNLLGAKQNIINDGDLTIAKTLNLQSSLNAKQDTINDGDLTIAKTLNLQSSLNAKQDTINDGDLTIAKTSGLQSSLNAKQDTINDGDLTIAKTSGLQSALNLKLDSSQINNYYTQTEVNNLVNAKQDIITTGSLSIDKVANLQTSLNSKNDILANQTGTGVDLLVSNDLRRIFGVDGINATIYLNLNNANDPKNYNIQISGSSLQNSINSLTTSVNTNSVDILALDSTVSSGFLARYTKTESDNRYYTQSEINTDIKDRFYVFNGGSYTVLNIQHSYGINLAVTSSTNPSSSEILLSMDSSSGVTINTSQHVVNNLSVGGSLVVGTMNIVNEITNLQNSSPNLSNYYTKTESDNLLNAKQNTITDRGGTGTGLLVNGVLSRIYGLGDIDISMTLNLNNSSDPTNYNIKVDGTILKNAIQAKQDLLTTSSNIDINKITINGSTPVDSSASVFTDLESVNILTNTIRPRANSSLILEGHTNQVLTIDTNEDVVIANNVDAGVRVYAGNMGGYFGQGYSSTQSAMKLKSSGTFGSDMIWEHNGSDVWMFYSAGPSLDIYRLGANQALVMQAASTGMVTFYFGHQNASDRSLKDNIQDVNEDEAIQALKTISAKTYTRKDIDSKNRIGFIAQDFENLPSSLGENYCQTSVMSNDRYDENKKEILTLDYDRTSVLLWQCCKNLLARVEALEAKNKK